MMIIIASSSSGGTSTTKAAGKSLPGAAAAAAAAAAAEVENFESLCVSQMMMSHNPSIFLLSEFGLLGCLLSEFRQ